MVTTRARKAAPICCDCHGRAESICGGCGKPICGSDACLAAHEHKPRKAAPNPHDQVARELAAHRRGIDRRKIREMAERYLARYAPADARLLHLGDLVGFGALVARQVRLEERQSVLVDLETGLIERAPKTRRK